jgi:phospholipid/cholesterol/gamma-HCH transport system substrate-binding protein
MELTYTRTERIVGIFVIGVIVLLLATVIMIGRGKDWFQKYVTYYTNLDESYGILVDTPVKLFKTDIGSVKNITLVGNRVEVTLAILEQYATRIRAGSQLTVESPTLIGSEYVAIKPGLPTAPLIPPGGFIPSKAKRSISDILAEFEVEKTAKMLVLTIQNIADITTAMKNPQGPLMSALKNLEGSTANVEAITREIRDGRGSVGELVASRRLIELIYVRLDQVNQILANVAEASQKAPGAMDQVQENLSGVRDILAEIDRALDDVRSILGNVETASEDLPHLTRSTRAGMETVNEHLDDVDDILDAVRENFLIKPNLPEQPEAKSLDSGLR